MLWSLSPCLLAFAHIDPELFTCVSWESCDKQPAHIVTPPLTLDSAAIIASVNRLCIVWIRAMCIIVDTCGLRNVAATQPTKPGFDPQPGKSNKFQNVPGARQFHCLQAGP